MMGGEGGFDQNNRKDEVVVACQCHSKADDEQFEKCHW